MEASGWPAGPARDPNHPECQIERDAYVSDFARHEGVQLEPYNIKKNPGLRACTKMMLNSMWGKFGQRDNLMPHSVLRSAIFSYVHGFGPTRCALRQLSGRTLGGSPLQSAGRV